MTERRIAAHTSCEEECHCRPMCMPYMYRHIADRALPSVMEACRTCGIDHPALACHDTLSRGETL
jgi:hypothetical protein